MGYRDDYWTSFLYMQKSPGLLLTATMKRTAFQYVSDLLSTFTSGCNARKTEWLSCSERPYSLEQQTPIVIVNCWLGWRNC